MCPYAKSKTSVALNGFPESADIHQFRELTCRMGRCWSSTSRRRSIRTSLRAAPPGPRGGGAEGDGGRVLQDDEHRAVGGGDELAHALDVDDGAAVNAQEHHGIELGGDVLQRLAQQGAIPSRRRGGRSCPARQSSRST